MTKQKFLNLSQHNLKECLFDNISYIDYSRIKISLLSKSDFDLLLLSKIRIRNPKSICPKIVL